MHEGHRNRMRERLFSDDETLRDHELLEILLFGSLPRRNTNDIAHRLIETFGGLAGVFRADRQQLLCVEGVGETTAALIKGIALCMERVDRSDNLQLPTATNFEKVSEYFIRRFHGSVQETMELYTADQREQMTLAARFTTNEADRVAVAPEALGKIIVSKHPYCIILVHNHPFASCDPSPQDDLFTKQVQLMCAMHNVRFYDHLIVSDTGIYSYHRSGKLEAFKKEYNIRSIFGGE